MPALHPGDTFPSITVKLPGGETLDLPHSLDGHFSVILFFRGSWCPYCNAQLRAFQRRPVPASPKWTSRSSPSQSMTRPRPGS